MQFKRERRYATSIVLSIESMATITDEGSGLHGRIVRKRFTTAKQVSGSSFRRWEGYYKKLYGRVGEVLMEARQSDGVPFVALEKYRLLGKFCSQRYLRLPLDEQQSFSSNR